MMLSAASCFAEATEHPRQTVRKSSDVEIQSERKHDVQNSRVLFQMQRLHLFFMDE